MAKGIWGGMGLQGASGSINKKQGGHTFLKNGVIRRRVVPSQPNTTSQGLVKSLFATISAAWLGLSLAAQTAWNAAAKSGNWSYSDTVMGASRNPASGKALFQQLNGNIVNLSDDTADIITTVPVKEEGGTSLVSGVNIEITAGSITTFEVAYSGALGTNESHVFEFTDTLPAGTSVLRKDALRKVLASTDATPADLEAAYIGKFGAVAAVGAKIGYRVKAVNSVTGQIRPVGEGIVETVAA